MDSALFHNKTLLKEVIGEWEQVNLVMLTGQIFCLGDVSHNVMLYASSNFTLDHSHSPSMIN